MGNRFLQEFIGSREVEAPPLPSIDGFSKAQFWGGRTSTLEDQSVGPLTNPIEHGFANNDAVVSTIKKIAGYKNFFQDTFGTNSITIQQVGKAIASFQRTLISGNSPFDRFDWDGEEKAISKAAKRGKKLFFGKARCNLCHFGTNFSDENFHNIGIGWVTCPVKLYHFLS